MKSRTSAGFSILEAVVAMSIVAILMAIASKALLSGSTPMSKIFRESGRAAQMDILFRNIELGLFNTVSLVPMEKLSSKSPGRYSGLAELGSFKDCKKTAVEPNRFSILRWTSILRRKRGESLIRPLEEISLIQPLRITHSPGPLHLFSTNLPAKEVVILDADGLFQRRYNVGKQKIVKTDKDPYDGVTSISPSQLYNEVELALAEGVDAVSLSPEDVKIVSSSTVLGSQTQILCTNNLEEVVLIDEPSRTSRVIFSATQVEIERFEFKALTKFEINKASLVNSQAIPKGGRETRCISLLILDLWLKDKQTDQVDKIVKTFSVPNFISARPFECDNP